MDVFNTDLIRAQLLLDTETDSTWDSTVGCLIDQS